MGTNATGTAAQGGTDGVSNYSFDSSFGGTAGVTVGGACTGACNLFSGNTDEGMELEGSGERNVVQGNYFGLDRSGLAPLGNASHGLEVRDDDNLVGGTVPEAANHIAANGLFGLRINTAGGNGPVRVIGNRIGVDVGGDAAPNALGGIAVVDGTHLVGGTDAGEGNLVVANAGAGITVLADPTFPARVVARRNRIEANAGLGIDLGETGEDGVSPNDAGDADPAKPNFPVVAARSSASTTTVSGTLERPAGQAASIDVYRVASCDPSGNGEGGEWLGSIELPAGAAGSTPFEGAIAAQPVGTTLTATATLAADGTSEFSACATVVAEQPVDLSLAMSADPARSRAGGAVRYELVVSHVAGPPIDDATLVVALPPGSTPGTITGASCTTNATLLTCVIGPVGVAANIAVAIAAILPASAQSGQTLVANASVTSVIADPDTSDNVASAGIAIDNVGVFADGFE